VPYQILQFAGPITSGQIFTVALWPIRHFAHMPCLLDVGIFASTQSGKGSLGGLQKLEASPRRLRHGMGCGGVWEVEMGRE